MEAVEVIRPRPGFEMSPLGSAKFGWFKRLYALAPKVSLIRSRSRTVLKRDESILK